MATGTIDPMRIVGLYSSKGGEKAVKSIYPHLMQEVRQAVAAVDAKQHRTKSSKEKTMPGRMLYNPRSLNDVFKGEFSKRGWRTVRVKSDYPTKYYVGEYDPKPANRGAFREMDFIKEKLGVEVQFGKYAFMVYNVSAKMTIFHKLGHIDTGIEIVPVKEFAEQMSTGVSYFEQFVWDLEERGVADIDIPAMIVGINV